MRSLRPGGSTRHGPLDVLLGLVVLVSFPGYLAYLVVTEGVVSAVWTALILVVVGGIILILQILAAPPVQWGGGHR